MKYATLVLSLFLASATPAVVPFDPQPQAAASSSSSIASLGDFQVVGTRIAELDSAHIRMAVDLTTIPSRTVTIESLHLVSLRLNGLPAFADPLNQPISLVQGASIALPPMYINAQLRDFTSVAPLREMVEKQSVHVQGQVVADIKMGFLEKLALRTQHPRVFVTLDKEVPVAVASTRLQRQTALSALTLVDFAMRGRTTLQRNIPGFESQWQRDAEAQGNASLVQVETHYAIAQNGTDYPVVSDQLGFRLNSDVLVTTAEATMPWEYDGEFQGSTKTSQSKVLKQKTQIVLRDVGSASQLNSANRQFTVDQREEIEREPLIVPKGQTGDYSKVKVGKRNSNTNIAVMRVQSNGQSKGLSAAPASIAQQDQWQTLAVYRLTGSSTSGQIAVDAVPISARRDGQVIRFDHPLDGSFFGSPIVTPEGVIGVVQDERTGALLPADLVAAVAGR